MPDKIDDGGPAYCPHPGSQSTGLTKRELFAAMYMQGLAANPTDDVCEATEGLRATWAVQQADALLLALTPKDSTQ